MKKNLLSATIALVILFCCVGLVFIYLPFLRKRRGYEQAAGSSELTTENIEQILSTIEDPGVNLNIVELGLIEDIEIRKRSIKVTIVLTSPFCPLVDYIIGQIEKSLRVLDRVQEVEVLIDRSVLWTPDRMSEEARQALGDPFR